MKKLLVMLLAVSMVLSMTFALAACGGDDNTDTSSKPTETSKEESKVDASTAPSTDDTTSEDSAVDSTEEPSVDSTEEPSVDSTEEPSVDSTEEPSAEPESSSTVTGPVDYKTTATKTNYAYGKTYTLNKDSAPVDPAYGYLSYGNGVTDWSDLDLKKMTDGSVGDITNESYSNATIAALAGVSVQLVGTNALYEYIIDLGDYYGDINSIKFRNVRDGIDNGSNRGFKVRLVYVSDDGNTWTKVSGTESKTQVPNAPEFKNAKDDTILNVEHYDFTYTLKEAAKGKFVRMILVSNGGYVIQLEEIEIWN